MSEEIFKKIKGKFDPASLLEKFPDAIPVILKKVPRSTLPDLAWNKLLMNSYNTVGDLYKILRKQINLPPETALFFFIDNTIPSISATFGDLYRDYKKADDILYITYTEENVYGKN